MRKLIVAEHISLDGVVQAPGGPQEDPSEGFRCGGWTVPFSDDAIDHDLQEMFSKPFELLLGRRTYDIWAAYWPHVKSDSPAYEIAKQFNSVAKHVATHQTARLEWNNSHALTGNLAEAVRGLLKKSDADLLTWGSADMVRQLLAAGLVDELRLFVYPVILGPGKRLFDGKAQPSTFTLAHSVRGTTGMMVNRYTRSGEVKTGSFV